MKTMTDQKPIPYIFHQTWKTDRLPRKLRQLQNTWQQHHPAAKHWLWTDKDNRSFLQKHYPWFVPVYDNYSQTIMRVDAVRYFILRHFGGIYVDLDFECLKPITPLLENQQLLIGCEPPQHLADMSRVRRHLGDNILCNAFIASSQGHEFWDHAIKLLVERGKRSDTLVATGPFFFTDAYQSYAHKETIHVLPSEILYPVDKHVIKKHRRHWPLSQAYAVHHWYGSWWTKKNSVKAIVRRIAHFLLQIPHSFLPVLKQYLRCIYILLMPSKGSHYRLQWNVSVAPELHMRTGPDSHQMWVSHLVKGTRAACALVDISTGKTLLARDNYPLISCLMVTRERYESACRAIMCFRRQSYPNKELVIIDDDPDNKLGQWVQSLADDSLVYVHLPDEKKSLGELRNLSLEHAHGQYIAQWDDDDLSHPDRLLMQMSALADMGNDVSFLQRQLFWMPDENKLSVTERRIIENTIVCKKSLLPAYPTLSKGEDTPVCETLVKNNDTVLCDKPELYIYVAHGTNTWNSEHLNKVWKGCALQYTGDAYNRKLKELEGIYGTQLFESEYFAGRPTLNKQEVITHLTDSEHYPSMLVLVPVKNAAGFLPRLFQNLETTEYPASKVSLAFLESDSNDGTYELLEKSLPQLRKKYARVELYKQDFGYQTARPRWSIDEQYRRRLILAYSRNTLLFRALRDEEWVMWVDVDVLNWPSDAFISLLDSGKDIVVPHCIKENGETFDLNTFKLSANAADLDWQRYIVDGILQPPVGYGRHYLGEFYGQELVELDAVGGTMLLVRADIHRQGLVFPAYSHRHYIETEGLAQMAIDMGYSCWGMPGLEIIHPA